MAKQRTTGASGADQSTGADAMSRSASQKQQTQSDAGGSMMDEAKDKAQQLADKAQTEATQQVKSGVATGKNRAADALGGVAQSLLYSSQQLRDQDQPRVSQFAERAANKVDELASYLRNTSPGEMADRVEDFARREPTLFLGGLFAVGFLGARFLKSSRSGRSGSQQQWQPGQGVQRGQRSWSARQQGMYPSYGQRPDAAYRTPGESIEREVPISTQPRDVDRAGFGTPGAPPVDRTRAETDLGTTSTDYTGREPY